MTLATVVVCAIDECERPARMAISTTRPKRDDLRSTVFYDDRVAPKKATRYCRTHGLEVIVGTLEIVDRDDDPEAVSPNEALRRIRRSPLLEELRLEAQAIAAADCDRTYDGLHTALEALDGGTS
jgi:hypothetical protein